MCLVNFELKFKRVYSSTKSSSSFEKSNYLASLVAGLEEPSLIMRRLCCFLWAEFSLVTEQWLCTSACSY